MIYNPAQPINIIFKSIDDMVEYARAADAELTQRVKKSTLPSSS